MNIHNLKLPSLFLAAAIMVCGCVMTGAAQTSAFTYQGRFTDSTVAQPTSGVYDMQFTLFDAASGGNQVGVPVVVPGVQVVNGIFTVSLDFIEEINTGVPKFLSEMKAEMPTYLIISADENTLISSIAKDWSGGLPFTILYNEKGEITYTRQGKVDHETLKGEIEKTLGEKNVAK